MVKGSTSSLQALKEIRITLESRIGSKNRQRGLNDDLYKANLEINNKIGREIEEYAVKKYKDYGMTIVPVCHRSGAATDRVNVQLKIKKFVGTEEIAQQVKAEGEQIAADRKRLDEWYFAALRRIASSEDIPEPPEF